MTPHEKLEALYSTLPTIECKRQCGNYCGPIIASKLEMKRLEEKRGFIRIEASWEAAERINLPAPEVLEREYVGLLPDTNKDNRCVFLQPGFCMAHAIRPLVCRLWGMMNNTLMRCPYGCMPTRWVTDRECRELHLQVIAIQKEWENETCSAARR